MAFPLAEVSALLAACHRRCCICHRFCGVKMETDHIVPKADGGPDTIDNAIPVCFECHAEIHLYNDAHPRGRKFRPDELRQHREQWLRTCETASAFLASIPPTTDVGPVQGLIEELEFNRVIVMRGDVGAPLEIIQFHRCITAGAFSLMPDDAKSAIFDVYAQIKKATVFVEAAAQFVTMGAGDASNRARAALDPLRGRIDDALSALRRHLGSGQ